MNLAQDGELIAGGAVLIALFVGAAWIAKKGTQGAAAAASSAVVTAAVDTAQGVIAGTAQGVGDQIGVPRTDQTQCQADLAAGNTGAASFSCPAATWIKSLFGGSASSSATPTDFGINTTGGW